MKPFSFIFAGTSDAASDCLNLLIESKTLTLKGVVSRPDTSRDRGMKKQSSAVKSLAKKLTVPVWTPNKASESVFLNEISETKCDFSFVCSYGQILPSAYLQLFPKGSLNLHFSLLPRWRGAAPVQRALMAGDQQTGVCLQIMTKELDAGDIIGQREFKISEEDNAEDIFNKSLKATKSLITKELVEYLRGELKAQPQNHEKKTYAQKIDKKEAQIIWKEPSFTIHNKIRALFLGPQAFSFLNGKRIKIYRSKVIRKNYPNFNPGEVCLIEKSKLLVACEEETLSLLEIQKEGKKRQKIEDFIKGYPIKLKDRLA